MTRIIWVTGRAASGKSTLIAEIQRRLANRHAAVHHLSDEDLLFQLKAADTSHQHHRHPRGDLKRFTVRSGYLFDEGIRIINTRLIGLIDAGGSPVVLVELARGRAEPVDVSYRRAFELIDPRVWVRSTTFRLDLPFATQVTRNQRRTALNGRATPPDVLHDLYRDDDPETFVRAGIPVTDLDADDDPRLNAAIVLRTIRLDDQAPQHVVARRVAAYDIGHRH